MEWLRLARDPPSRRIGPVHQLKQSLAMAADTRLVTLLRSLQTYDAQQNTVQYASELGLDSLLSLINLSSRLLASASSVLTSISNPHNVSLLTAQLLSSPAIWTCPDGLQTGLRFMSVYRSAAQTRLRDGEIRRRGQSRSSNLARADLTSELAHHEWVKAVLKAANAKSPSWRHLLVISGMLVGFETQDRSGLSKSLRTILEAASVKALNLSLEGVGVANEQGAHCIALALSYSFQYLSDFERSRINYEVRHLRQAREQSVDADSFCYRCSRDQLSFL